MLVFTTKLPLFDVVSYDIFVSLTKRIYRKVQVRLKNSNVAIITSLEDMAMRDHSAGVTEQTGM